MSRPHRRRRLGVLLLSAALLVALGSPVSGQLVVHDAATTARNTVTAAVTQLLLDTERQQHLKIREMARRLSALTNLRKYALEEVPRWRTHGGDFVYASRLQRCAELRRRRGSGLHRAEPAAPGGRQAPRSTRSRCPTSAAGAPGDREPGRCGRHRGHQRHRPAPPARTQGGTPGHRRTRTRRDRSVTRPEHDRRARQDQWRRPDWCAPAPGAPPAARRHRRTTPGGEQTRARHRDGGTDDAAGHVARRSSRGATRSWPGRATRSARGGSRKATPGSLMDLNLIPTIQQAIASLLLTYEPEFLRFGHRLFLSFATIILAWHGIRMMFARDGPQRLDVRVRQAAAGRVVRATRSSRSTNRRCRASACRSAT